MAIRLASLHVLAIMSTCCLNSVLPKSSPILTALALAPSGSKISSHCIASEKDALLTFKASLADPANYLSSWQGEDCCRWKGVGCSNHTGHVVELQLYDYDNSPMIGLLQGEMSSSLLQLQHLERLDFRYNDFGGSPIPTFIGALKNLRYLTLSMSNFSGPIPPHLGNLSSLLHLNLHHLNGEIHSDSLVWLTHLRTLEYLDLGGVNLGSVVDWPHALNMLPSLQILYLQSCNMVQSTMPPPLHSNLTSLNFIDLSDNYFNKYILWAMPDMPSLQHIYLPRCGLQGLLPEVATNSTELRDIDLSGNNITGIPGTFFERLHKLERLELSINSISGPLPEVVGNLTELRYISFMGNHITNIPASFKRLHKLQELYFMDNNLTGSMPDALEHMRNLRHVDLSFNKLEGSIPQGIGSLTQLEELRLDHNNLDGRITEVHFEKLDNLHVLYLYGNSLRMVVNKSWVPPFKLAKARLAFCRLGPGFPEWLRSQDSIDFLDISNTSLTGIIPDWFWTIFSRARILFLANNQITGTLPETLLESITTEVIDISSNMLKGQIPVLPANLTFLDLSNNSFSGPLPSHFGSPHLKEIFLFSNSLSGTVPTSLCKSQSLEFLDLSKNLLDGSFPNCWEDSGSTESAGDDNNSSSNPIFQNSTLGNIIVLKLEHNKLTGEFPTFLQSCRSLTILDLSYNGFSGILPTWIGEKLLSLKFLLLRSNIFFGHIPQFTKMENLQYLDLAGNNISGNIPQSLLDLVAMTFTHTEDEYIGAGFDVDYDDLFSVNMLDYADSSLVVTKGQELKFNAGIRIVVNIDLSCNNLRGRIPRKIGKLKALKTLNLSWNHLSGTIPESIGGLRALESFDLSNNELSGEIPASLSALTSLSHLNFSYNNLSGVIPSGYQLRTLDSQSSIYMGNPGLCGPPLSKGCSDIELPPDYPQEREGTRDAFFFYLGVGISYMMGLWVVFCAFLFSRTWRVACFSFSDRLQDRLYVQVAVSWAYLVRKLGTN